jgi:2-oxoglutarate dehydrogenase E2 component (dihydrolipoamide succinyltransferase)
MTVSVEVPSLGESVTEAIIAKWRKQEGEYIEQDEVLAELDTDKISVDVPAPAAGVISSLKFEIDDDVEVGEVIAEIDTDADQPAGDAGGDEEPEQQPEEESGEPAEEPAPEDTPEPADSPDEVRLSPAVRRLVDQHNLDPTQIEGSGPDGRLTKGDVKNYVDEHGSGTAEPDEAPERPDTLVERETGDRDVEQLEDRVRMSSLRQTIADRLLDVKNETAMLTTFQEADMSKVLDLRSEWKEKFQEEYDINLGFMSFFVKACIDALKRYPSVNAELDGEDIVYKNYYNVGVAVGGPDGLVVPVVDNADQLSFADTEQEIQNLVDKVYDRDLTFDDLEGGTFTITNGGIYGSMLSTPILNPPQSAILGMHNIVDRPVAVDGEVEIRPIMYLALSYDHRIIDGKEAVSFLKRVKECIEEPSRMLLEV